MTSWLRTGSRLRNQNCHSYTGDFPSKLSQCQKVLRPKDLRNTKVCMLVCYIYYIKHLQQLTFFVLFLVIFGISVYTSVLVDFVAIFKICVELSPETEFSKRRQDLEFPTVNDNDTS